MNVPGIPFNVLTKNDLLAELKTFKPESDFQRIMVNHHGRPVAIILSIPDWNRIQQKWSSLWAYVRALQKKSHQTAI